MRVLLEYQKSLLREQRKMFLCLIRVAVDMFPTKGKYRLFLLLREKSIDIFLSSMVRGVTTVTDQGERSKPNQSRKLQY